MVKIRVRVSVIGLEFGRRTENSACPVYLSVRRMENKTEPLKLKYSSDGMISVFC